MQETRKTFPHPFSKAYWQAAVAELHNTRVLVFAALMIALRVAMKPVSIPIAADLRINSAFLVNAFGAMVFGPVVAALAAAVTDTLGCLLFPHRPLFLPVHLRGDCGVGDFCAVPLPHKTHGQPADSLPLLH